MIRLASWWLFRVAMLALLALAPACSCQRSADSFPPAPAAASSSDSPDASAEMHPVVLDVTNALDACSFGHRGVLLDFGDPSMVANLRPGSLRPGLDEFVERQGATWLRVRSRVLSASFYWPAAPGEETDPSVYVEARVRGVRAHDVSVAIDGKTVGTWTLAKGETRIVSARAAVPMPLGLGGHELTLHFVGGPRAGEESLAEIDWAHIGVGDSSEPYAAPTHAEVVVDAAIGGHSIRALSLRSPGFARCSGWIPADATLETSLATSGGGDAEVEARLVRDRRPPVVLGAARIAGGDADWARWSVPVTGLEGHGALASLELVVKRAPKGTRVLFGAPRVVAAGSVSDATPPPARGVLLVVLGSTPAKALAPWGGPHAAPELTRLAAAGTTFLANRAPTSLASAVMASILSGIAPLAGAPDEVAGRLGEGVTTVQQACRQGGIATAMFTADPTTGAAFGFRRGWDDFVSHDPLEDVPGTRVFDEAAAWIEAHKDSRFLVVVHARGGHPPWDVTPDELKAIPPPGYLGMIDPRRAAEALAKARKHPARFKEDDRIRAWALYDHALDQHDAALGRLLATLRSAGREDDTAVVVTSDVAASEAVPVPFGDPDTLDEPLLATPLVVRWPAAAFLAGRRVSASTTPLDLARTVLDTLGLRPPAAFEGVDLGALAQGPLVPAQRPLVATRAGRFSLRWGSFVLSGARDHESHMCDLSLDPACIADVRGTSPLALESMRRAVLAALPFQAPAAPRPAIPLLDEHTTAALIRWGRVSDDRSGD